MFTRLRYLIALSHAHRIARRYFVTNGFDGVLTMLGLLMGFRVSGAESLELIIGACLGGVVALFMSGLTSAYISESAEKANELRKLEKSMLTSLEASAHAEAARLMPWLIALVNGLSPLLLALLILAPLFLAQQQLLFGLPPLDIALTIALVLTFLLGAFLGRVSGKFWLWTGVRALMIAGITSLLILFLHQLMGVV
jgi:predicted membrane protein (TIGR00267 family)